MGGGAKVISVNGYYDGHNYIIEGNVAVRPNQRVIITFLDEDFDASSQQNAAEQKFDTMKGFFGSLTHEEAEDIRKNRVNFKERV